MSTTDTDRTAVTNAVDCVAMMANGTWDDFVRAIHPDAVNREASHEPAACRAPGPAGFHATAQWLRSAFPDLRFEIDTVVADGDHVVVHNVMRGTQIGPMVYYGPDGAITDVFPARGREFAATQSHWIKVRDGQVVEHRANRDDIGMAKQLGWIPPTPAYVIRMKRARRAAVRAAERAARRRDG